MSSVSIFDIQPDIKLRVSYASAPSVRLFPQTYRAPMPTEPEAGTGDCAKTKRLSYVPYWVTWMYRLTD